MQGSVLTDEQAHPSLFDYVETSHIDIFCVYVNWVEIIKRDDALRENEIKKYESCHL